VAISFRKTFRGYDTADVGFRLAELERAIASGSEIDRARARQALRTVRLNRRFWGYASRQVDHVIARRRLELQW